MRSIVGIFHSPDDAKRAADRLQGLITPEEQIRLLTPDTAQTGLEVAVPVDDAEEPGVGRVIGAVLGAAIGLAAGAHLGAYLLGYFGFTFVTALVFGIGTVAMTFLGLFLGQKFFGYLETKTSTGVPHDDLLLYQDALRHNHSLVVALADNVERAEFVGDVMKDAGAESVNAAEDQWWLGLRDVEKEHLQDYRHAA